MVLVIDAHVTKDENCYPMVVPGNAQMIGLPERCKLEKQSN